MTTAGISGCRRIWANPAPSAASQGVFPGRRWFGAPDSGHGEGRITKVARVQSAATVPPAEQYELKGQEKRPDQKDAIPKARRTPLILAGAVSDRQHDREQNPPPTQHSRGLGLIAQYSASGKSRSPSMTASIQPDLARRCTSSNGSTATRQDSEIEENQA